MAIGLMPLPRLWAALFFVMLLNLGSVAITVVISTYFKGGALLRDAAQPRHTHACTHANTLTHTHAHSGISSAASMTSPLCVAIAGDHTSSTCILVYLYSYNVNLI